MYLSSHLRGKKHLEAIRASSDVTGELTQKQIVRARSQHFPSISATRELDECMFFAGATQSEVHCGRAQRQDGSAEGGRQGATEGAAQALQEAASADVAEVGDVTSSSSVSSLVFVHAVSVYSLYCKNSRDVLIVCLLRHAH